MLKRDRWILLGATGLGVGYSPAAPGTFGSLVGLGLAWGISGWPPALAGGVAVAVCGLAVWLSHEAEGILGAKDPGLIVIDEVAGMLVACWGLTLSVPAAIALFALFRLFDITKPFPVGWLDRHLTGGLGIVADDVAAGILANLVYRLGSWMAGISGIVGIG